MEQDKVSPIKPGLVGFVCLFPLHWWIYRVRFLTEQCHMSWWQKQRCVNGLGRFFCINLSGCCRIVVLKGEDVKLLDRTWWRKTARMSVSFCVCKTFFKGLLYWIVLLFRFVLYNNSRIGRIIFKFRWKFMYAVPDTLQISTYEQTPDDMS